MERSLIILDGQSAWLYPSVFPSILTDFERGLLQNQNVFLTFHKHKMPLLILWAFLQTKKADLPTLSYTLTGEIPTLSYTMQTPGKRSPFGRSLPVWAIIGSTPRDENKERIACTEGGSCSGTPVEIQRSSVCYNALKMTFFNLNQAWCYQAGLLFVNIFMTVWDFIFGQRLCHALYPANMLKNGSY